MTALRSAERPRPLLQLAVGAAIGVSIVIGLGMILLAMTVGSCDAFGGRCPAERPPLLEDDVFGMVAFGTVLVVAVPMFLSHPSKRRFVIAAGVGLVAAFLVGMIVSSAAHAG
ncbi:MAG TPA: hypothetical protein VNO51_24430 [Ilumatobacteraceae bacterium]|nr:hypothetical protein [Ilumatobacteraceae bacterium]